MPDKLHIALVANYRPDGQYSMLRFADVLEHGLREQGHGVTRIEPARRFGGSGPLAKWRGYLDKYLLFPRQLQQQLKQLVATHKRLVVHIVDHSNAPYLAATKGLPCLITCHDLMAIKSALGLIPQNKTRWSGRILQRWIFRHLKTAPHAACISHKTQQDLLALTDIQATDTQVILNGLPFPFTPTPLDEARQLIAPLAQPYFIHVGSDAWYKNRRGVLALYLQLRKTHTTAKLVFVGPSAPELQREIEAQLLGASVIFIRDINDAKLQALYSAAACLLFPSLEEGFGWPIAEAQAGGCPVAILDREPMTEVGGNASIRLTAPPTNTNDAETWATENAALINTHLENRSALVNAGLENAKRFTSALMVKKYADYYQAIVTAK